MRRWELPLTALRTFEAAARLQSFKHAAAELRICPTTVSNQIRDLERRWGCLLFIRRTRRVTLTEVGRSLSQVLTQSFDAIQAEVDEHVALSRRTVNLAVGPIFASRWLTPRLARFRQSHPDIELILHHGPRIADARELSPAVAVAIDWGRGDWRGLEARRLYEIRYAPVVSPKLLRERGGLRGPADLVGFPILHQHDRTEWRAWMKEAGAAGMELPSGTVIVDANVVTQAAISGQGVALGVFPFLAREIAAGVLVRPFDVELAPKRSYYLLVRPGARETSEVGAVCGWLEKETERERRRAIAAPARSTAAGHGDR